MFITVLLFLFGLALLIKGKPDETEKGGGDA